MLQEKDPLLPEKSNPEEVGEMPVVPSFGEFLTQFEAEEGFVCSSTDESTSSEMPPPYGQDAFLSHLDVADTESIQKRILKILSKKEVKRHCVEFSEHLSYSHNNIYPKRIAELLEQPIVWVGDDGSLSQILFENAFATRIEQMRSDMTQVKAGSFKKNKLEKKSILMDLMNDIFISSNLNPYDTFVFALLIKTYDSMFYNDHLNDWQKTLLYKTQPLILEIALTDQQFFYNENHAGRIVLDFILNKETHICPRLLMQFDEHFNDLYFSKHAQINDSLDRLLNNLKLEVQSELFKQVKNCEQNINTIESVERFDDHYFHLIQLLTEKTHQTTHLPTKQFIDRVWAISFVKKLSSDSLLDLLYKENFEQALPAELKLYWGQSMRAMEDMIAIAENNSSAKSDIDTLKNKLVNINKWLGITSFELSIDPNVTRTLFTFLKFRVEVFSRSSNTHQIQKALEQMAPSEKAFTAETIPYVEHILLIEKANREIERSRFKFDEFINIGDAYIINEKHFKVVYVSNKRQYFVFLSPCEQIYHVYPRDQIWELIKNKTIQNAKQKFAFLNFINFLAQSNKEIILGSS